MIKKQLKCTKCLKQEVKQEVKRDTSAATEAARSTSAKDKREATFKERYGVTSSLMINREENWKRVLGVDNPSQLESVKKIKAEKATKRRLAREEIRDAKTTAIFGTAHPTRTQRLSHTCQEKYGVDNPFQLEKVIKGTISRNADRHFSVLDAFSLKVNATIISQTIDEVVLRCNACSSEFILKNTGISWNYENTRCEICYPKTAGKSLEEKEVVRYIRSIYDGEVIENSRHIIAPKELDIWIPNLNLAIEYNGEYWHSNKKVKHLLKWQLALAKGIELIQIWDFEWKNKRGIIESIIRKKLGLCPIVESTSASIIDERMAMDFLQANDIYEPRIGTCVGLYHNDELVHISSFIDSNEFAEWELANACDKRDIIVSSSIDIATAFFGKSVVYYCDQRLMNIEPNSYDEIGMLPPNKEGDSIWGVGHKVFVHY